MKIKLWPYDIFVPKQVSMTLAPFDQQIDLWNYSQFDNILYKLFIYVLESHL